MITAREEDKKSDNTTSDLNEKCDGHPEATLTVPQKTDQMFSTFALF